MNFLIAQTLSLFHSSGKRNHLLYNMILHANRHPEKGQDLRIFLPRHFPRQFFFHIKNAVFLMEHGVGKREQKRSTGIVVPVQGTLAQRIQVGHQQNANENAHGRERFRIHHNIVPEIDGPGVEEYHFQVKNDKEHGHHIEFYREHGGTFPHGNHPAFVGNVRRFKIGRASCRERV